MHTSQIPELRLEQVSLQARSRPGIKQDVPYLLRDISFQAFRGDRVAIVGASGAGKTSLLRLLNRLVEPSRGEIFLGQERFTQVPVLHLRQQVVLVSQEARLLDMTVQQALEYPLRLRQLEPQIMQQRVGEWLERLHIPSDWLNRTELQLSLGQRQRVAIVRALVTQPRVLLLDEPTSALDVGRSQLLLEVLQELTQSQSTTVLMTNHQLELAEQFATRVLHLQQGLLVQDASTAQVEWSVLRQQMVTAETRSIEDEWE
ncbi:MAG TPA: ATP-binding cassette domain-containing protein [Thermosynechococcaceae cyanobacterium]